MLTSREQISKGLGRKCPLVIYVVTLVLLVGAAQGSCQQRSTPPPETPSESGTGVEKDASSATRAEYAAYMDSYWEGIDTDTLSDDEREQRIVDYVYLTLNGDAEMRRQCWLKLAEVFGEEQPNRIVVDYLGESDSPLYSPEMLEEYLATLTTKFEEGSWQRMRVDYLLEGVRKNRTGSVIANLDVVKADDGERTTLHGLIAQSTERNGDVKVLLYDPECEECAALIERLSPTRVSVIAVSVTGETLPSGKRAGEKALPTHWLSCVAADEEQLEDSFYLPKLPQLYTVGHDGVIK